MVWVLRVSPDKHKPLLLKYTMAYLCGSSWTSSSCRWSNWYNRCNSKFSLLNKDIFCSSSLPLLWLPSSSSSFFFSSITYFLILIIIAIQRTKQTINRSNTTNNKIKTEQRNFGRHCQMFKVLDVRWQLVHLNARRFRDIFWPFIDVSEMSHWVH